MRLRNKLIRGLAYTFAFGLVSISLLTRRSGATDLGPVPGQVMSEEENRPTVGKHRTVAPIKGQDTSKPLVDPEKIPASSGFTQELAGTLPSGITIEPPSFESGLVSEQVRRTSSSAVSIQERASNELETSTSSSQPFSLEQIREQEIATNVPPVQEMMMGSAGTNFTPNAPERGKTDTGKSRLQTPLLPSPGPPIASSPRRSLTASSPRSPVLQSSISDPTSPNTSQSQSARHARCSPCCSNSVANCFNSLSISRSAQASPRSIARPPSLGLFQRSSSPTTRRPISTFASENPESSQSWLERATEDQLLERLYHLEKESEINEDAIINEVSRRQKAVQHRENEAEKAANERGFQIDTLLSINGCGLRAEETGANYRDKNYEEDIPWQQRLVVIDSTKIESTNVEDLATMASHTGNITLETVASVKKELAAFPQLTRDALKEGRTRVVEVARKKDHLRVLPVIFGKHGNHAQNVNNIVTLLNSGEDCIFSANKEVVSLVKEAYGIAGKDWPSLRDTPITNSLQKNLFSIGKDNVGHSAINPKDISWVGKSTRNRSIKRDLKVIRESIERRGNRKYGMIFVDLDDTHDNMHYEAYNEAGTYLGIMDRNTMLLYADSRPYPYRYARESNKK